MKNPIEFLKQNKLKNIYLIHKIKNESKTRFLFIAFLLQVYYRK